MTVRHPLFARFYSRVVVPGTDRRGGTELRRRNLAGSPRHRGRGGSGRRRQLRAATATPSTGSSAFEPEPYLRERAARHADERVELREETAQDLPLADGGGRRRGVLAWVLCSVDQDAALGEARRVLRPGWRAALPRARAGTGAGDGAPRAGSPRRHRLAAPLRWLPHRARHGGRDRAGRLHRHRAGAADLPRGLPGTGGRHGDRRRARRECGLPEPSPHARPLR